MKNRFLTSTLLLLATQLSVNAQVTMRLDASKRGPLVSPYQYGLFFEEINHAGDGGLYAEMVSNRSFEEGHDNWTAVGSASLSNRNAALLNEAQGSCLRLFAATASDAKAAGVMNNG